MTFDELLELRDAILARLVRLNPDIEFSTGECPRDRPCDGCPRLDGKGGRNAWVHWHQGVSHDGLPRILGLHRMVLTASLTWYTAAAPPGQSDAAGELGHSEEARFSLKPGLIGELRPHLAALGIKL
jgi:hypothetical protein